MTPPPARAGPGAPGPPGRRGWRPVLLWGLLFALALLVPFLLTHHSHRSTTADVKPAATSKAPATPTAPVTTSRAPVTTSRAPVTTASSSAATATSPAAVASSPSAPASSAGTTTSTSPTTNTPAALGGTRAAHGTYVVRSGDTLWSITAAQLGSRATKALISSSWPTYYAQNRSTIGHDPNLLRPGEVLQL